MKKYLIYIIIIALWIFAFYGLAVLKMKTHEKTVIVRGEITKYTDAETVYVTESGTKYHKSSCSSVKESCKSFSLDKAKKLGYLPCKRCCPEEN